MSDHIHAQGKQAEVSLDPVYVTITYQRPLGGDGGHHRIPIAQIAGIRWRPATTLVPGFIQFTIPGTSTPEVTFTRSQQPALAALKSAAEHAIGRDRAA
jgi:hypothetical protein